MDSGQNLRTLRTLFRAYRRRILFTYGLFNLENLLELARPLVLGLAVNGLLRSSYFGLLLFVAQHLSHMLVGTLRRTYDTRAFTGIYTEMATQVVLEQRGRNVEVSQVAARWRSPASSWTSTSATSPLWCRRSTPCWARW